MDFHLDLDHANEAVRRRPAVISLFWFALLTTAAFAQQQVPTGQSAATTVSKLSTFVPPSFTMKAPYPPATAQCRHLVGGVWQIVPCATDEDLQQHPMPPPATPNSIESDPHHLRAGPHRVISSPAVPFVWGSVAVNITSDPTQMTESDGTNSSGNGNAFSIQDNTNTFPCAPCKANYPFGPVATAPGASTTIPGSASNVGDNGWIQFTYQNYGTASQLCIWTVDSTVANNTGNIKVPKGVPFGYHNSGYVGYHATCVYPPVTYNLTGSSAAIGAAEVFGYITCPTIGSNVGCNLQIFGYLPWAGENPWYNIGFGDVLQLAGNWINVSGTMLGSGGSAQAIFSSNTQLQQVLRAYTCFVAPQDATGYFPQACAVPNPITVQSLLGSLDGSDIFSYPTGETNNLTNGTPTLSCEFYDCTLSFNSTGP
jgi:hypothetical protein